MTEISPDTHRRPELPVPPEDSDCCRSGCDPCVFDLHAAAMERYRAELKAWEEKMAVSAFPTAEDK